MTDTEALQCIARQIEETGGDVDEAERRFEEESAGSPRIKRQRDERDGTDHDRAT